MTGYRRDVSALLSIFDVFVLPSYREGMPRALLEAMATGIPVVATDIRGCREEVVDGATGILVPVRDPEAVAVAVTGLLGDTRRAASLGAAARSRVIERFDERRITELQVDRLERLHREQAEK
jgi:glycosyltransferase involved in cell wall biosynthesis